MKKALFFLLFPCFLNAQQPPDSVGGVWLRVEQMPVFAGCAEFAGEPTKQRACSDQKMVEFISNQLVYPPSAIEKGVEGTVVVRFVIDENGAVTEPSVIRDLPEGCGEAALRVVRAMPKWTAGRQKGQAVRVKMNLPIRFAFKKNQGEAAKNYAIVWGKIKGTSVRAADLKAALDTPLFVRDADGNALKISELSFIFEKKKQSREAHVNDTSTLDKAMRKVVAKASAGGQFTIVATIQDGGGKFSHVEQTFSITD